MQRAARWMVIPLAAAALVLSSCNESVDSNADAQKNHPVLVNTTDAVTFTVDAANFNFNIADSLSFSGTPVVRTLVVSEYSSGTGYIIVEGSASTVLLSDTLNSDRILAGTTFTASAPTRIAIALTNYSGKVTFALARQ